MHTRGCSCPHKMHCGMHKRVSTTTVSLSAWRYRRRDMFDVIVTFEERVMEQVIEGGSRWDRPGAVGVVGAAGDGLGEEMVGGR